jgi:hypothetical protein
MKLKILFVLIVLNLFSDLYADSKEYSSKGFKLIQLENPKGEINFISKNEPKIKINIEKVQFDPKCNLKFIEEGTTLRIVIDQENMIFDKATCISKVNITAPKEMELKISTGTAPIKVDNFTSAINFKSATGDFTGLNMSSHFSGTTATGAINLKYNKCPERADIDLISASSDAEIIFPSPCKIKVSHKSATGELFNEIGESSDYKVLIKSKSASGNLKILKLIKK